MTGSSSLTLPLASRLLRSLHWRSLRAPAFAPVDTWRVEQRDDKISVGEKRAPAEAKRRPKSAEPSRIVIVGCGAAGFAATEMLRRQKYEDSIVMLSNDDAPPVDRPICRRTISPAARRRNGSRCAIRASIRARRSTFVSIRP